MQKFCFLFIEASKIFLLECAWFIDPAGTRIGIIFGKSERHGYFTHNMFNVLRHYNMDGAWLKLKYMGGIDFMMKVKNLEMAEVKYLKPTKVYDFVLKYFGQDLRDYINRIDDDLFASMDKWLFHLTHSQATKNNMVTFYF